MIAFTHEKTPRMAAFSVQRVTDGLLRSREVSLIRFAKPRVFALHRNLAENGRIQGRLGCSAAGTHPELFRSHRFDQRLRVHRLAGIGQYLRRGVKRGKFFRFVSFGGFGRLRFGVGLPLPLRLHSYRLGRGAGGDRGFGLGRRFGNERNHHLVTFRTLRSNGLRGRRFPFGRAFGVRGFGCAGL
jgi:hypothetical protein